MKRFIEGEDRSQSTLFPERLDDYIAEDNPIRVIEVFVEELDLQSLGFDGMQPELTGRPGYHPSTLLKIYIYGYLKSPAFSVVLPAWKRSTARTRFVTLGQNHTL
jgi:transposase